MTRYSLISPKFLPRYVDTFLKKIKGIDVYGVSLRDLGNVLTSDKKRTNQINREQALDVVEGQLDTLAGTGKKLMTNEANSYAFRYSSDIINAPLKGSSVNIIDYDIPLYEMIIHGCVSYSSELLNFKNADDMDIMTLKLIEFGAEFASAQKFPCEFSGFCDYVLFCSAELNAAVLCCYNYGNVFCPGCQSDTLSNIHSDFFLKAGAFCAKLGNSCKL